MIVTVKPVNRGHPLAPHYVLAKISRSVSRYLWFVSIAKYQLISLRQYNRHWLGDSVKVNNTVGGIGGEQGARLWLPYFMDIFL